MPIAIDEQTMLRLRKMKKIYSVTLDQTEVAATYDVAEATGALLITNVALHQIVAAVSTGAATVAIIINHTTATEILTTTAIAGLTVDTRIAATLAEPILMLADDKIQMVIGTETISAGTMQLVVEYEEVQLNAKLQGL